MSQILTFSSKSRANLKGVDPRLIAASYWALSQSKYDFRILKSVRTVQEQRDLYAQGRTKPGKIVTWTLNSKHIPNSATGFSEAIDFVPLNEDGTDDWQTLEKFDHIADLYMQAAKMFGCIFRHGADWDRDGKKREKGESDSPHIEIVY